MPKIYKTNQVYELLNDSSDSDSQNQPLDGFDDDENETEAYTHSDVDNDTEVRDSRRSGRTTGLGRVRGAAAGRRSNSRGSGGGRGRGRGVLNLESNDDNFFLEADGSKWSREASNNDPFVVRTNTPTLKPSTMNLNSINDFFNFLVNDKIIETICLFTNKNIGTLNLPIADPKNHIKLVTLNEMRGFIGLLILFGLTHKNNKEVNDIW